jgi:hypothetical protein
MHEKFSLDVTYAGFFSQKRGKKVPSLTTGQQKEDLPPLFV